MAWEDTYTKPNLAHLGITATKVDSTFENNFVEVKKNRGNAPSLALHYMVKAKKTVNVN